MLKLALSSVLMTVEKESGRCEQSLDHRTRIADAKQVLGKSADEVCRIARAMVGAKLSSGLTSLIAVHGPKASRRRARHRCP